uniref:Staygreen protein domain-containing protein n=1 Tax=Nelumbo nucifera TaxID=4432 RepID=A0A822ZXH6_NELNU|nr:TPA_asm: hypothetical protein HUJ06_018002 [Nelumbo nucifera]
MGFSAAMFMLSTPLKPSPSLSEHKSSLLVYGNRSVKKRSYRSIFPIARLFGPAIFEASKLNVLFLGVDQKKHPGNLPRAYTLTHSDITAKLTLAISHTINSSQLEGWYHKLQRDEVVAEWKKVKGKMSLHVHCHISGGHFLLDLCARLRYFIFRKELPVVLKAFVHGDGYLFNNYPELKEALVWVYFHSNIPEFNHLECWGPLEDATAPSHGDGGEVHLHFHQKQSSSHGDKIRKMWTRPETCPSNCTCCFPSTSLIPWSRDFREESSSHGDKIRKMWTRPETCPSNCTCCFPSTSLIPWSRDFREESHENHQKFKT